MLMFGSFEFIATGIGRLLEDAHYKYTDHDGPAGYYHIGLRVLLLLWFLYNCKSLQSEGKKEANVQKKFKLIGVFYFLSLPLFIGMSKFLPGHVRYRMVMVGLNVV
mmetsp:Transcript_8309/g.1099  ORF Transcript_8309/g.1099 Transcript_8309/m.1099 type:complete len:106 (-) Transcript_8309:131-448(-)